MRPFARRERVRLFEYRLGFFMATVMFVSVAQSFRDWMELHTLEPYVERAWPVTVTKAFRADRVVAVCEGFPVAAWRLRAAFPIPDMTWKTGGREKPRVGLSLGASLPILPEYAAANPNMRSGCAVLDLDLVELIAERDLYSEDAE